MVFLVIALPPAIEGFYRAIAVANPYRAANCVTTASLQGEIAGRLLPFAVAYQGIAPETAEHFSAVLSSSTSPSASLEFAALMRQQQPALVYQVARFIHERSREEMDELLPRETLELIVEAAEPQRVVRFPPFIPDPWTMSSEDLLERLPRRQHRMPRHSVSVAEKISFHLRRLRMKQVDLAKMVEKTEQRVSNWKSSGCPLYVVEVLQRAQTSDEVQQLFREEQHKQDKAWKVRRPYWEDALRLRALAVFWDISLAELAHALSFNLVYLRQLHDGRYAAKHLMPMFQGVTTKADIFERCRAYRKNSSLIGVGRVSFWDAPIPRPFYDDEGNRLVRETRLRLGMTRAAFAASLNVSDATMYLWESGRQAVSSPAHERIMRASGAKDAADLLRSMKERQPRRLQKKGAEIRKLTRAEEKEFDKFIKERRGELRRSARNQFPSFSADDLNDVEARVLTTLALTKMRGDDMRSGALRKTIRNEGIRFFWKNLEFSPSDRLLLTNMRESIRRFTVAGGENFSPEDLASREGWPLDVAKRTYGHYLRLEARYPAMLPFDDQHYRVEDGDDEGEV